MNQFFNLNRPPQVQNVENSRGPVATPESMLGSGIAYERPSNIAPRIYEEQMNKPQERNPDMEFMAVIGKDLVFAGRISQEGSLDLLGQINGEVELTGAESTLMVNESGVLTGSAVASEVIVHGSTNAVLQASNVEIHPTATTRGAVNYDRISIIGDGDNEISLKRNPVKKPV